METEKQQMQDDSPVKGNFIEIDKVIRNKSPRLYSLLPGFIIRYLKRTIRQDDINEFIRRRGNLFGLPFADAIIEDFGINVIAHGMENIPASGRYIIASKSPFGRFGWNCTYHCGWQVKKRHCFPGERPPDVS